MARYMLLCVLLAFSTYCKSYVITSPVNQTHDYIGVVVQKPAQERYEVREYAFGERKMLFSLALIARHGDVDGAKRTSYKRIDDYAHGYNSANATVPIALPIFDTYFVFDETNELEIMTTAYISKSVETPPNPMDFGLRLTPEAEVPKPSGWKYFVITVRGSPTFEKLKLEAAKLRKELIAERLVRSVGDLVFLTVNYTRNINSNAEKVDILIPSFRI